ncbi:MAG: ACP S-malonyltransferase [Candidatus Pelagibacter sp.]
MFSIVFPGQGSQKIGMVKEFYEKYDLVKRLFRDADAVLNVPITKIIFEGPENKLNSTENAQPAIFLASYCIFETIKKEFGYDFKKFKYFAGHSLGEYSALACVGSIKFEDTLKILKKRGEFMQEAVPSGEGAMLAVLGVASKELDKILEINNKKYECFIANDNSNLQVVVSGLKKDINLLSDDLNDKKIKNLKLNVSAPFHCKYMKTASDKMTNYINDLKMNDLEKPIISNVTASETSSSKEIKSLLISQIEKKVRWLESVEYMINNGVKNFVEIGPGKVLSGLIKRINKNVNVNSINSEEDIKLLIND